MLSIVMPTYNRASRLKASYLAIKNILSEANIAFEMIIVNDGSSDNTSETLHDMCQDFRQVKGIDLAGNFGQQNATLAGIREAKYHYVVTIDDDLRDHPQDIISLYREMSKGYDVVYGVPKSKNRKIYRNLGTCFKEMIFRLMLGKPKGLKLTSFRIMNRKVADYVCSDHASKVYVSARILKITKNIGNIETTPLTKGEPSHYTLGKLIGLMVQVVKQYSFVEKIVTSSYGNQYDVKEIYK